MLAEFQPLSHHWLKRMAIFWHSLVSLPPECLDSKTPTWAEYLVKVMGSDVPFLHQTSNQ
jgi:hypothetical protein